MPFCIFSYNDHLFVAYYLKLVPCFPGFVKLIQTPQDWDLLLTLHHLEENFLQVEDAIICQDLWLLILIWISGDIKEMARALKELLFY